MIRFSIVVPTYRDDRYVGEALDSALAQPADLLGEVLVADDASPGTMRETLERARSRDPRGVIRLIVRERNLGLFANLNAAIAEAREEWVVLLCQDDVLLPDALTRAAAAVRGADLVLFANESIDSEGRTRTTIARKVFDRITEAPSAVFGPGELVPWLLREGSINGNLTGMVFRRTTFAELGGFDAAWRHVSDWELVHRFAKRGGVRLVKEPIARVRVHEAQLSAVNARSGIQTEEVAFMVSRLRADESVRRRPEADRWARGVMQHYLWAALKLAVTPSADRATVRRMLRAVHETTGLGPTAIEMLRLLPRRLAYKAGWMSRDEPLT